MTWLSALLACSIVTLWTYACLRILHWQIERAIDRHRDGLVRRLQDLHGLRVVAVQVGPGEGGGGEVDGMYREGVNQQRRRGKC